MNEEELNKIVWDKFTENAKCELREERDSFVMNDMPFHLKFNNTDDPRFIYEQEGKNITLIPVGYKWNNSADIIKSKKVKGVIKDKIEGTPDILVYEDIFNKGISIENEVSKTGWKKIIKIDDKDALGDIPNEAEYLEFIFELETDFDIKNKEGVAWDRVNESVFREDLTLTDNLKIESVKAWYFDDNKESEICNGVLYNENSKLYLKKQIPASFIKNSVSTIYTDIVITYGSEYVFNAATTQGIAMGLLSNNKVVIAYTDIGSYYGTAIIADITGTTISYGSEYVFNTVSVSNSAICVLTETTFVIAYLDNNTYYGTSVLGTVSLGTVISFSSKSIFNYAQVMYVAICTLTSTKFVIAYQDLGATSSTAVVGVSNGSSLSYSGNKYVFNAYYSYYITIGALTSTKFVISYNDGGYSNYSTCIIGNESAQSITFGSKYSFNTTYDSYALSVGILTSTSFILAFSDYAQSHDGYAMIGTVSGNSISFGSKYLFIAGHTWNYNSIGVLSPTKVVIANCNVSNSNYGVATVGTISGNVITFGDNYTFNASSTAYILCTNLSSTSFIIAYEDVGNSNYGIAIAGTVPPAGKKINGVTNVKWNGVSITKWNGQ